MALLGTLVDNFCDPTLDTATWNAANSAGNSGFQAGCRYTFIVQAGATGDATLTSDVAYDLTGSHVHIELISAGVQEAGLEMYPIILTEVAGNQDDSLLIVISNGLVGIYEVVGGVPNGLAFPAYVPSTMAWWRIREQAGTVYYESAADVRGPWTTQASVVPTVNITALFMKVRTFDFLSLTTAKQTAVSNVNYLAPPDVPFPNGAIPVLFEAAFGADIYGDQSAWTWTDLSDEPDPDFMDQAVNVTRGRADESNDVTPTAADFTLDNPEGNLTPSNPASIYWPNVKLGTPARWALNAGTPRLKTITNTISQAVVEDIAALDLTGDLDIRIDLQLLPVISTTSDVIVASKYNTSANQRSWRVSVNAGGYPQLEWSTDGALTGYVSAESTYPGVPLSARTVLRVTLDVNNGAAGNDVTFYTGESMTGPWTQIGAVVTTAGVTSVFASTSDLIIGTENGLGSPQAENRTVSANVHAFQLRDGINGTAVVDADFGAQISGVPAFVDSTGLAWTMLGTATLTDRWNRITGTVDTWKPKWPWGDLSAQQDGGLGEGEARVDLEVAGILRRLGTGQSPLDSPLRRAEQADVNIRAYWPMEDENGSTQFASALPGGAPMIFTGEVDLASNELLLGSKPLPEFSATTTIVGSVVGTFTGHFIIDWYAYFPAGLASSTVVMWAFGTGTVFLWQVALNGTTYTVTGYDFDNNVITTGSGALAFVGQWSHLRLFVRQDGANVDWDFVYFPVTFPASSGFFFSNTYAGAVGGVSAVQIPASANLDGVSFGHIAVYDALNSQQDNAAVGWLGDTAVARMQRLCDEQSVSFLVIGNPATSARMGVQQINTLLELLRDAQDADGGILYEQMDGVGLIYRTRDSMYNQPPNIVLDGLQKQLANPLEPSLDDYLIRNYIVANRVRGSSFVASDPASIAEHGLYDESVELNLYQDADLVDAAGWMLHLGSVDEMRFPQASTNLGVAPEMIDAWLTVDSGARADLVNLPPQVPMETIRLLVQGYKEDIDPTHWNPTANTTPAEPWDVFLIFDDADSWVPEELDWRLDPDDSVLTVDLDDNDTTMFVTADPPWVDDNAETPFDLLVNGERMTVTDIDPPVGDAEFVGAGDADDVTSSVSFVAPSVVAAAAGDLLICAWCSYALTGTYTLPGGMFIAALTDGTYTSMEDATEVLGGSGATGTRTATFTSSDTWSAISIVAHGASGTPAVTEFLSDVETGGPAADITLTTVLTVNPGDWLLAIQSWDWDPGNNMGPVTGGPAGTWTAVADSAIPGSNTSRTRAWAIQATEANTYSVTFPSLAGINDNHARLYVMSGVTGLSQEFTVVRSVNGVVRAHPTGTRVELWYTPGLAR